MQAKGLKILVLIESIVIFICSIWIISSCASSKTKTELYRGASVDNMYTLVIYEIVEPDWPFGKAHYEVKRSAHFYVDVADDDGHGIFM